MRDGLLPYDDYIISYHNYDEYHKGRMINVVCTTKYFTGNIHIVTHPLISY